MLVNNTDEEKKNTERQNEQGMRGLQRGGLPGTLSGRQSPKKTHLKDREEDGTR